MYFTFNLLTANFKLFTPQGVVKKSILIFFAYFFNLRNSLNESDSFLEILYLEFSFEIFFYISNFLCKFSVSSPSTQVEILQHLPDCLAFNINFLAKDNFSL